MTTTAWRFRGTEGADEAVLRLKQLDEQDLINVQDVAVVRWPQYARQPSTVEHVTDEGGKLPSIMRKLSHPVIPGSVIESVKGDIVPGTSALVLLSSDAEIGAVAGALEGMGMELIRSDLSVQQEDQVREAFAKAARTRRDQPPS